MKSIYKTLIACISVLFSFGAEASEVASYTSNQGVHYNVYTDSMKINHQGEVFSFRIAGNMKMDLARGNQITIPSESQVYLEGGSGNFIGFDSEVQTPEPFILNLENGETISFACGARIGMVGFERILKTRYVRFYPSGEYKSGCSVFSLTQIGSSDGSQFEIAPFSKVELFENGDLKYAEKLNSGKVNIQGQMIPAKIGTQIDYHQIGQVNFFYPVASHKFTIKDGNGQEIKISYSSEEVSMQFFQDGDVKRMIADQEIKLGSMTFPAGVGISYAKGRNEMGQVIQTDAPYIDNVLYSEAQSISLKNGKIKARALGFNREGEFVSLFAAETIAMHVKGQMELIPQGALVSIDGNKNITDFITRDQVIMGPAGQPGHEL